MSSIVLDEDGFRQLAGEMEARLAGRDANLRYEICAFLGLQSHALPLDERRAEIIAGVVQKLYAANVRAYVQLYAHREETRGVKPIPDVCDLERRTLPLSRWSDVQFFKAIDCLLYQMSEGTVERSTIYRKFEKFVGRVAIQILKRTPEYDAARYGWGSLTGDYRSYVD